MISLDFTGAFDDLIVDDPAVLTHMDEIESVAKIFGQTNLNAIFRE